MAPVVHQGIAAQIATMLKIYQDHPQSMPDDSQQYG
jgi:hypothetical protein